MRLPRFLISVFQKNSPTTTFHNEAGPSDAWEQFQRGLRYDLDGSGPQDDAHAVVWYRKSAEQGLAPAQDTLGKMYEFGRGVPQDSAQAVVWYRKAAEQDYFPAQVNLGDAYKNGNGVPQSHGDAYFWYSLAVSRSIGCPRDDTSLYREMRDDAAVDLTSAERSSVRRRVRKWIEDHPGSGGALCQAANLATRRGMKCLKDHPG